MQEVVGSSPISSTDLADPFHRVWRSIGFTLGGFVAGEGWFGTRRRARDFVRDGSPRLTFGFSIEVARRDRHLLEALERFLGVGSINDTPARKGHHKPLAVFAISSLRAHHAVTIPFAEAFLLPCAKRRQFEAWRDSMTAYEARRPSQHGRGRSQCSVAGCTAPVRGRGLCRRHYYRATGY